MLSIFYSIGNIVMLRIDYVWFIVMLSIGYCIVYSNVKYRLLYMLSIDYSNVKYRLIVGYCVGYIIANYRL